MDVDVIPADPEEQPTLVKSSISFPVVGIGASAGGLATLQRFLDHMPANNGMAFVVVLHLSPHHESSAAAILQRHTKMPVVQVTVPVPIEADHVYVIPPSQDLTMNDGSLCLRTPTRVRGPHVAIDVFFRTLAHVHEARSVSIILSGTGADSSVGLKRVKEQGGVTLAQAPDDAEFHEMPRAAIATGMVDFVLPVVEMPQRLLDLWRNAQRIWLPVGAQTDEKNPPPPNADDAYRGEKALQDIMGLLRQRTGHDFRHYKRATVLRRIERRLQVCGVPHLVAYCEYLRDHAEEATSLLQDLLISVTNFFRDREAFDALEREVIPGLFEGRQDDDPLRAWIAACATGEEAYSVSILLRERMEKRSAPEIQIFATDIDARALATARAGVYPGAIRTDVSPSRLTQYFHKEGDEYRVTKAVREPVLFAQHNVLRDPPFTRLDLICCRNLLIYLGREAQASILEMFRFALKPGGYLFLGTSESADAVPNLFTVVDKKHRIYRANPHAHAVRYLPLPGTLPGNDRLLPALATKPARERARTAMAELHAQAIERLAPPSVLIDQRHHILHLSEGAGRFFEHGAGVPTVELVPNVHPSLRVDLRAALFQASQTGQRAEMRRVPFERDGTAAYVSLSVSPLPSPEQDRNLMLVTFEESEEAPTAHADSTGDPAERGIIVQLEGELEQMKDQLRSTLEHADVSTEELKASNEELQAINEELRSATEELETSKEELQSMNEELITVNYELKTKVEETGKVNDDLQNFIVASDIATVFIDGGMRIKRFTPQASVVFNMIATDVDRPLLDITHRLDYEKMADDIASVFRELRIVERPIRSIDGKHFLARIRPYRTTDDKIAGAVLTFVDVTELREAEQQARLSEERMRLAALTTRDYVIVTMDEAGVITSWNEGARRTFGYEEAEVLGQHVRLLFKPDDRTAGAPEHEMRKARETGRAEDERWHLRKNGATFFCSGVMTPLHDGATLGFVKIARDVTGSKTQESAREALLQREQMASSEARSASELKDQFLAVMSHELKHPLNLIQVNAELLLRMPALREVAAVQRAGNSIRGAVRSQAKIIDDLLDLSRARTGKLKLSREPVQIAETLAAIVETARPDARRKRIKLSWKCSAEDMVVPCDRVRLQQIAWNLLNNAIKFTPMGGRVEVALAAEDRFARLSVTDSGCGITADFLPKVFGMFSQEASSPLETREGGLGIGLALVEQLSVAQGGRVKAESPGAGQGATFSVWLPLDLGGMQPQPATSTGASLNGLRILAVDDMPDALEPFALILESEGASVDTATSGRMALELLGQNRYDLLISDLGMPGMTGYQLIAAVRQLPDQAHLCALAVTGYGRAVDAERALREGFDAHIGKPVDFDLLKQAVAGLRMPGRSASEIKGANSPGGT